MKLQVIRQRGIWWTLSSLMILVGILAMVISWQQIHSPLRPSLDFVGGTRLQLELDCRQPQLCDRPIDLEAVRNVLSSQNLGGSSVQIVESQDKRPTGLSIRASTLDVEQRTKLQAALTEKIGKFDEQKTQIDTVGPTVGQQLFSSGLLALIVSFVGIAMYLSFRFQWDYAIFAIVALLHDVLITVGSFAIMGLVLGTEVDSLFIVALLTIVGFSVNDTVVIYDRVREVIKENPAKHIDDVVDDAVNQTLTRSINTTLTVLLTLVSIFLFGGETLKYFALALIIGFTMGAYSSIFIASTLLALWRERTGKAVLATAGAASPDEPEDAQAN
jgi:preprotein translocase subunit SecF